MTNIYPIQPIAVNLTLNKGACSLVRKPTLWQRIKRWGVQNG